LSNNPTEEVDMAQGDADKLDEAFKKAWDKVPSHQKGEGKWHRAEIMVEGSNPITTYRVVLTPQSG